MNRAKDGKIALSFQPLWGGFAQFSGVSWRRSGRSDDRGPREHATEGLIVVEGFFTVFEFYQRGRKNAVALMGSSMSKEQERLIVETVGSKGRVLLALDNDAAGRKGSEDAVNRLRSQVFVREMAL